MDITILGIESSCDDTSAAVLRSNVLLSNVIASQAVHVKYGGVIPELASRAHQQNIVPVVDTALREAGVTADELDAIAFTRGPGLVGSLLVGVSFTKGLSIARNIPMVEVNHLQGHILSHFIDLPDRQLPHPSFPFLCLLVSGGHTQIVRVDSPLEMEIIGTTIDDAAGEAFDKVAKALGLGYPGGPIISKLAETGNPRAIDFPRALNSRGDYRFSLSGLKTAVTLYIEQETKAGRTIHLPDLAASFEAAVFDVQYKKAKNALHATGCKEYCIGGGVSANPHLREMMIKKLGRQGIRVTVPPLSACTDNAAMIAEVARRKFDRGEISPFDVDADPNMTL